LAGSMLAIIKPILEYIDFSRHAFSSVQQLTGQIYAPCFACFQFPYKKSLRQLIGLQIQHVSNA